MKKNNFFLNFSLSTSAPKSSRALHADFDSVKKMKINQRKQNIISQTSIWKYTSLYKCWTDMLDCKPISLTMRSEWVGMLFSQPSYSNSHSQCNTILSFISFVVLRKCIRICYTESGEPRMSRSPHPFF